LKKINITKPLAYTYTYMYMEYSECILWCNSVIIYQLGPTYDTILMDIVYNNIVCLVVHFEKIVIDDSIVKDKPISRTD
jgi:hypothetical protein